jgi:hypothetical protein
MTTGYDETNNALTLDDDDSLKVGDYELQYDSTADQFEVVDPDGNTNHVPRSTSGSLVPQGLAESVSAGEALADDGNTYSSIQTAVDNASGWVFVGAGTFTEHVVITTNGMMIEGCGYDTLIDNGSNENAMTVDAANVTVKNLSVRTDPNVGSAYRGIEVSGNGDSTTIDSVVVRDADAEGVTFSAGSDHIVRNVTVQSTGSSSGINMEDAPTNVIVSGCTLQSGIAGNGVDTGLNGDQIVANCTMDSVGTHGINNNAVDSIMIGNRIDNSGNYGIDAGGSTLDQIVANNRISDSGSADIDDGPAVDDDNLTGTAN